MTRDLTEPCALYSRTITLVLRRMNKPDFMPDCWWSRRVQHGRRATAHKPLVQGSTAGPQVGKREFLLETPPTVIASSCSSFRICNSRIKWFMEQSNRLIRRWLMERFNRHW